GVVCDNECLIHDEGTYNIHPTHASYQSANVMDMENFNISLGTYYSILDSDGDNIHGDDSDYRYAARAPFKYFF
ncbi:carbohydrate porin, partial [Escherichia coli]